MTAFGCTPAVHFLEALRCLTAGVWWPADSERFVCGLALLHDGVECDH